MNEYMFPLMLVLLASVFQGTFGLGMKYIKPGDCTMQLL